MKRIKIMITLSNKDILRLTNNNGRGTITLSQAVKNAVREKLNK